MKKYIIFVLLLPLSLLGQTLCPTGSTTCPTAQLPQKHVNPILSGGLKSLMTTATTGLTCNPGAHIWCAPHSGSGANYINNGTVLMSAITSAASAISAGTSVVGEVVVDDAGYRYDFSQYLTLPYSLNAGCQGGWIPADIVCRGRLPIIIQPNPTSPLYLVVISNHYPNVPVDGIRAVPVNGDGYSSPESQVANMCTGVGIPNVSCTGSDYATIGTPDGEIAMYVPTHGNGYAFVGQDFSELSTKPNLIHSPAEIGDGYQLIWGTGVGQSGGRGFHVVFGSEVTYTANALTIDVGTPMTQGWVQSGSCGSTPSGNVTITAGAPTYICFMGLNTNYIAGQETVRFTYAGIDWPASDITILAESGCAAGATIPPQVCVVDSTHAYVKIQGGVTNPANGGVHWFYLINGPSYQAGTEYAPSEDSIVVAQAQSFTVACATCPTSNPSGVLVMPITGSYPIVAQGTVSGPNATNWTSTYTIDLGNTTAITGVSVNVGTQTITATAVPGAFSVNAPHNITVYNAASHGAQPILNSTPQNEIDVIYKGVVGTNTATKGIDHCELTGHGRYLVNYGSRGSTYTEVCYGIGTTWTSALNCTGVGCTASNPNYGADVIINSIVVNTTTKMTINYTVDSVSLGVGHVDAEEGSRYVLFLHDRFHGDDGQILKASDNTPCTTSGITCYEQNAYGTVIGLEANSSYIAVVDSYVDQIHVAFEGQDSSGINIGVSQGPGLFQNNFISAATEDMIMGGTGAVISNSPVEGCDVEVTGNYFYKPIYWDNYGISIAQPGGGQCSNLLGGHPVCVMSVKDKFELKTGCRVHVWNNVLDHNWIGASQFYYSVNFTPRMAFNQGLPSGFINDITFEKNLITGINNGFNSEASDTNCIYGGGYDNDCGLGSMPAPGIHRVVVDNNVWVINQNSTSFGYTGYNPIAWLVYPYLQDWVVSHNTIQMATGVAPQNYPNFAFYAAYYNVACNNILQPTNNLWFINNTGGLHGSGGTSGCTPNAQTGQTGWMAQPTSTGNTFANRYCGNATDLPSYGTYPSCDSLSVTPTVTTPVGATGYISHQVFQGNYEINGTLPGLANWINPCSPNCQTTDGSTANVSTGANWAYFNFMTDVISGTTVPQQLTIITTTLPFGAIGQPYSTTLQATGGSGIGYTWSIILGTLPPGLNLDSVSGIISGTPILPAGTSNFTVQVEDSLSHTATQPLSITIYAVSINPSKLMGGSTVSGIGVIK